MCVYQNCLRGREYGLELYGTDVELSRTTTDKEKTTPLEMNITEVAGVIDRWDR